MSQEDSTATALDALTEDVCQRLARNQRVRRRLPGSGRLHLDRQLPFLCLHRLPVGGKSPTQRLITAEASYLIAPGDDSWHAAISRLCRDIAKTLYEPFGAFLVIEVWSARERHRRNRQPFFRINASDHDGLIKCRQSFEKALSEIRLGHRQAEVEPLPPSEQAPPGMHPLDLELEPDVSGPGCFRLNVEVEPVYHDADADIVYPLLLRALRHQFSRALKHACCAFSGMTMIAPPDHYEALGRREVVRAVGDTDERLSEIADLFDFLLLATPTNTRSAWNQFEASHFKLVPSFYYRPLPFDPDLLKRQLYSLPLEEIEDPTLELLLRERRDELDLQISMLRDRGSLHFLYGSLQLYGYVEDEMVELAQRLLRDIPEGIGGGAGGVVNAAELQQLAEEEIGRYQQLYAPFEAKVELRDDIAAGLMVSEDRLFIDRSLRLSRSRVEPLLHHEIGTHLLTYFNGRAQPLQQLARGLAGYESLQEGLAVFAEYLAGGLEAERLRLLAARVIACRSVADHQSFLDTFQLLTEQYDVPPHAAFTTTVRVHRGGGLTKDAIYLRGLQQLLDYLQLGHQLEPLYAGKMALRHVPALQELRRREIVQPPPLRPRCLDLPGAAERLQRSTRKSLIALLEAEA